MGENCSRTVKPVNCILGFGLFRVFCVFRGLLTPSIGFDIAGSCLLCERRGLGLYNRESYESGEKGELKSIGSEPFGSYGTRPSLRTFQIVEGERVEANSVLDCFRGTSSFLRV